MACGVPQGLILRPLLFNLYMPTQGQIMQKKQKKNNRNAYQSYAPRSTYSSAIIKCLQPHNVSYSLKFKDFIGVLFYINLCISSCVKA